MDLRYTLSFLRTMKIPGLYPIMKDWQAFIRMHFIYAAYESGLLQALATPRTRDELIRELDVKRPELLDALLDVGLAAKELAINNGFFHTRGKRSKTVMGSNGDMLAAMIQANVTYYGDAYRNAADRIRGGELGDDLARIGDLVARFSKISEPIIKDFISGIVRGRNPLRIFDIGCGSGVLLKSAFDANSLATGVGLDIDEAVVQQARRNILAWDLSDRFEILCGDIRHVSKEIAGPFDVITLYNLLYYFEKTERLGLLQTLRGMLVPQGVLAVAMGFRSNGRDIGMANLNLVNSSLKGVTSLPELREVMSLLKQCGFGNIEVHRFMPRSTFYGIVGRNGF
jgi:2-polyprenyl-3-methyl-5-hydroxy-6-metoxy-1,4-benzoquinol methylase